MGQTPHELNKEFPEHTDTIHQLKIGDAQFATLADAYHHLNRAVHRTETGIGSVAEPILEGFKKQRLALKDEIAACLARATPTGTCAGPDFATSRQCSLIQQFYSGIERLRATDDQREDSQDLHRRHHHRGGGPAWRSHFQRLRISDAGKVHAIEYGADRCAGRHAGQLLPDRSAGRPAAGEGAALGQ
jgi:uncharacterized protein YdcH (DUF465 family)